MSQRKPRSPRKTSKGIKNTKLRWSARIANSSQETIDNEPSVISDETKSASEIEKMLPDIIPPRRITRSATKESQGDNKDDNETNPSTDKSELTEDSSGKEKQRCQDSAMKSDPTHHPSPASDISILIKNTKLSVSRIEQIPFKKSSEFKPNFTVIQRHWITQGM